MNTAAGALAVPAFEVLKRYDKEDIVHKGFINVFDCRRPRGHQRLKAAP